VLRIATKLGASEKVLDYLRQGQNGEQQLWIDALWLFEMEVNGQHWASHDVFGAF